MDYKKLLMSYIIKVTYRQESNCIDLPDAPGVFSLNQEYDAELELIGRETITVFNNQSKEKSTIIDSNIVMGQCIFELVCKWALEQYVIYFNNKDIGILTLEDGYLTLSYQNSPIEALNKIIFCSTSTFGIDKFMNFEKYFFLNLAACKIEKYISRYKNMAISNKELGIE